MIFLEVCPAEQNVGLRTQFLRLKIKNLKRLFINRGDAHKL